MNNHPIGFLIADCNDVAHTTIKTCLLSSNYSLRDEKRIKSSAVYIEEENLRKSITILSIRSLVKSTWKNTNSVYLAPKVSKKDVISL
jgi:hypothetical protein